MYGPMGNLDTGMGISFFEDNGKSGYHPLIDKPLFNNASNKVNFDPL